MVESKLLQSQFPLYQPHEDDCMLNTSTATRRDIHQVVLYLYLQLQIQRSDDSEIDKL